MNGRNALSVVVPSYNVEKYFPLCIDSLLKTEGMDRALMYIYPALYRYYDDVLEDHDAINEANWLFGINSDKLLARAGFDVNAVDGDDYPGDIRPVTGPGKYDINRLYVCRKRC